MARPVTRQESKFQNTRSLRSRKVCTAPHKPPRAAKRTPIQRSPQTKEALLDTSAQSMPNGSSAPQQQSASDHTAESRLQEPFNTYLVRKWKDIREQQDKVQSDILNDIEITREAVDWSQGKNVRLNEGVRGSVRPWHDRPDVLVKKLRVLDEEAFDLGLHMDPSD
ncbi:hypothetical protein ACHAP5_011612 [Fusarium lateritium]